MDVIFLMCIYRQFKICTGILIWNENDSMQLKSEMKYSKNIVGYMQLLPVKRWHAWDMVCLSFCEWKFLKERAAICYKVVHCQ